MAIEIHHFVWAEVRPENTDVENDEKNGERKKGCGSNPPACVHELAQQDS
jgi:hypothetical protein